MIEQLGELEVMLASGIDLLAALDQPAEPVKGARWAWNLGLVIGLILASLAMILGIF